MNSQTRIAYPENVRVRRESLINDKDMTKDLATDPSNGKALLQNAILWKMKKRAFSFSRSRDGRNLFVDALNSLDNDLNLIINNSNPPPKKSDAPHETYMFRQVRNSFSPLVLASGIPPDTIFQRVEIVCT